MGRRTFVLVAAFTTVMATATGYLRAAPQQAPVQPDSSSTAAHRALLDQYCVTCHNDAIVNADGDDAPPSPLVAQLRTSGIAFDTMDLTDLAADAAEWERVVRKVRAGVMPPAGRPRPDEATQDAFVAWLEGGLDRVAAAQPDPGRTATFHRLNRSEYQNAIRDLLALDVDTVDFLPADDSSYGFDNIGGVLRISESLLERYLAAAKTISRMVVGSPPPTPQSEVYRNAQDLQQHDRIDGLPFGTRGGMSVEHFFPQDAEYEIRVILTRPRGLDEPHPLEVTIDRTRVELFGLEDARGTTFDARIPVTAGPHEVGVAFHRNPGALVEQVREPFPNPRISGNTGGPGGSMPFVNSMTISGPFDSVGRGTTPSCDRLFSCTPSRATSSGHSDADGEASCARTILSTLARRAYRGQGTDDDVDVLLDFYQAGRRDGDFNDGIELALRRLLVSPQFLFRIEAPPEGVAPDTPYRVSDLTLASRLSFFLWSSIPDDELLEVAEEGRLSDSDELTRQVRRMLADPRAASLTTNFAGQWLQLRNLAPRFGRAILSRGRLARRCDRDSSARPSCSSTASSARTAAPSSC